MFAATVDDLISVFRSEVSDAVAPYLWTDEDLIRYVNGAVNALAVKTNGLIETLSLPVAASATFVKLPARVLHIYSAKLSTSGRTLRLVNENDASTDSTTIVRDTYPSRVTFTTPPLTADTLVLRCSVTLEYPLELGDDLPFTALDDQELLLHYMKWKAYGKHDAETFDAVREMKHQRYFEDGVREREQELRNHRRAPGLIKMEW